MRHLAGYTLIELLVSLLIFVTIFGFIGLNSFSDQLGASRETDARNKLQDTIRVTLMQINTDLEQAGGSWATGSGENVVNCADPTMACLVVKTTSSSEGEDGSDGEGSEQQFWLGFKFMNSLSDQRTSVGCNQVWYIWEPNIGLSYKSVSYPNTCIGEIASSEDSGEGDNTPDNASLLLKDVLAFNASIYCRTSDGKILEATYASSGESYGQVDCGSGYPSMARIGIFAASEGESAMDGFDRTAYYSVLPDDSGPLSPRCIETILEGSPSDPPEGVVTCPLGKVCACLERSVDLPNFRFIAFP